MGGGGKALNNEMEGGWCNSDEEGDVCEGKGLGTGGAVEKRGGAEIGVHAGG